VVLPQQCCCRCVVLQCPLNTWCCQYWGVAFFGLVAVGDLHDGSVPQMQVHGYLTCAWICCRCMFHGHARRECFRCACCCCWPAVPSQCCYNISGVLLAFVLRHSGAAAGLITTCVWGVPSLPFPGMCL